MIGDSLQTACCFSFCTLFESSASVFSLQQGAIRAVEKCCDSAPFFQGGVTTKFIEENKEQLLAEDAVDTKVVALCGVSYVLSRCPPEDAFRVNSVSETKAPFALANGDEFNK